MSTATYDPKSVIVTVNGNIVTGFADGTFVKGERNEDTYSNHVGVDGKVTRVKNNNETGTITITLQHNSPSNRILEKYASNGKIVNINITDTNFDSDVGFGGSEAWVKKPAAFERGKEVGDREWTLDVADYDQVFKSNDAGTTNS